MARPGGPGLLSSAQREAFFQALRVPGCSRDLAAQKANIDVRTLYRWLARGKAKRNGTNPDDEAYRQFRHEVERVEGEAELATLALIAKAATPRNVTRTVTSNGPKGQTITTTVEREEGDWAAAAWILERRKPKKYARKQETTLKGDKDAPLGVVFELDIPKPNPDGKAPAKSAMDSEGDGDE